MVDRGCSNFQVVEGKVEGAMLKYYQQSLFLKELVDAPRIFERVLFNQELVNSSMFATQNVK